MESQFLLLSLSDSESLSALLSAESDPAAGVTTDSDSSHRGRMIEIDTADEISIIGGLILVLIYVLLPVLQVILLFAWDFSIIC